MGRQQTTFLLLVLLTTLSKVSVAQTDAEVLLQAEDWASAFGWNESSNMCSNWTGVICGSNDRVTNLGFGHSVIVQTSPSLSLPSTWSSLSQLENFHYGDTGGAPPTRLTGSLPASWGTLTSLTHFEVYYADTLSGPLPDAWNDMIQLISLTLVECNISGTLPESWSNMTHLAEVLVTNSQLTGTLPASWAALNTIYSVNVTKNNLNGSLPMEWSNLMKQTLNVVDLSINRLSGSLPESWGGLSNLVILNLSSNALINSVPTTWSAIPILDLTNTDFDCPEALINDGVANCTKQSLSLSTTTWARCKKSTLLPVCAAEPECFDGLTDVVGDSSSLPKAGGGLCNISKAKSTLIVLWCLFASLLAIMWCMFVALRCWQGKQLNGHVDSNKGHHAIFSRMQLGWDRALKWKPWGLKLSALIGLGMFYSDKASDITLLKQVFGHTWTGYVLLVLLLGQYVLQGYVLVYHLTRKFIGWTVLTKLFLITFVLAIPLGVLLTIVLDVLLFFSDLGIPLKHVDQQVNLEQYQLFRDAGRALYGTLPTGMLQSVTFTLPANPQNQLDLSVKVFIFSFVTAGLQLLKVNGEVMYFALKQKEHAAWVFWQLLSARKVVKEAPILLLTAHSGVELLAGQHAGSSDQNIA